MAALVVLVVALLAAILTLSAWAIPTSGPVITALVAVMASLVTGVLTYIMRPSGKPPTTP